MPKTPNRKSATALPATPPSPKLLMQRKIQRAIEDHKIISLEESSKKGSSKSNSSFTRLDDFFLVEALLDEPPVLDLVLDFFLELFFPFVAKLKPHPIILRFIKKRIAKLFSFCIFYLSTNQIVVNIFIFFLLYRPRIIFTHTALNHFIPLSFFLEEYKFTIVDSVKKLIAIVISK